MIEIHRFILFFLTNANNLAQIVAQKTNTAVCFKGKRSNSGVPGKETIIGNNKHTLCTAVLSQHFWAHIADQMLHQSDWEFELDRGNCIIITRIWAPEAGLLSWYTAWNYTSNRIKQSNDLVLSRTRCQSGMCADPWTVLFYKRSVLVKSWWCWKRTTSVLMKSFRWGVKHLPVTFNSPVNPLLDLYRYKCCILLAFITVGAILLVSHSSLLKVWLSEPIDPLDQSWY